MKTLFITFIIVLTFNLNVCARFHKTSEIENNWTSLEYYIDMYIQKHGFDGFTSLLEDIRTEVFVYDYWNKSLKNNIYRIYYYRTVGYISEDNKLYVIDVVPKDEVIIERYISDNIYDREHNSIVLTERPFKLYRRDKDGWVIASFDYINKYYTHYKDKINNPEVVVFNTNTNHFEDPNHYIIVDSDKIIISITEIERTTKNNIDYWSYVYKTVYTLTPCKKIKGNYRIKVDKTLLY